MTKVNRDEIEILRKKKYTLKEVARLIGVVPSAVWYELKSFTRKGRRYDAAYAHHRAYARRKYARAQGRTIGLNAKLQKVGVRTSWMTSRPRM